MVLLRAVEKSYMLLGKEDEKAKNEHLWDSCFASSAVLGTYTIQGIGASPPIASFQDRFLSSVLHR